MKLGKAIVLQTNLCESSILDPLPVYREALKLLIEAGKRVLWHKERHEAGYYELLPGETED